MKVAIVIGTRPEIIKLSPVIRVLEKREIDFFILHTGQHYSYDLNWIFFQQLGLPDPKYNLNIGSHSPGRQVAKIIAGVETVLVSEQPDVVLVLGDTNSVFAGAFVASKLGLTVGHIEAGLRSYDRNMPEEINRILTDHCSDLLFAPTEEAVTILKGEGISENVFMTGNTIVDAVYQNLPRAKGLAREAFVLPEQYFLATVHRAENVDNRSRFLAVIQSLQAVAETWKVKVFYPIHPHAISKIKEFGISLQGLDILPPVDYLHFLDLEKSALAVLTDSGGVQEEACILGTPCVALRDNTERPETITVGSNVLVGVEPRRILEGLDYMLNKNNHWRNPFGDGKAAERIVDVLEKLDGRD
ncbi:hypothetical protein LCGC14_0411710 [marine sediment metagenome]|uniref:UDP-N-acetylglucosamine 2-epimerase domain-containing protein n=1 Tax=marine sediment metagenome TaxID=412755 RepID=A0A0F9SZF3_9ZZZZ